MVPETSLDALVALSAAEEVADLVRSMIAGCADDESALPQIGNGMLELAAMMARVRNFLEAASGHTMAGLGFFVSPHQMQ